MKRNTLLLLLLFATGIIVKAQDSAAIEKELLPLLDFDIYLMIGQSNCAGRGYMIESDTTDIIPGVWLLNAEGRPEPAKAPFNRYSNIRKDMSMQMIGPAVCFAPIMHENTGRNILIIQNAKGGSGLWEWEKKELIDAFNDVTLPRLTKVVPNCHKVESDGLECRSDDHSDPHFSRASNIELGRRYAEAMLNAIQ